MSPTMLLWADQTCRQVLTWLAWEVVYSSVLLGIIWFFCRGLQIHALRWRYGLLALVFVRLIIPPTASLPWSARQIVGPGLAAWWTAPIAEDVAQDPAPGSEAFPGQLLLAQLEQDWPLPAPTVAGETYAFPQTTEQRWAMMLVGLWLTGVLFMLLRFYRRRRLFRRIVSFAQTVDNDDVLALAAQWQRYFRIRRSVRVVSSGAYPAAFTIGTWHPYIFLPRILLQTADRATLEAVMAHEMAHIKRFDDVSLRIQNTVKSIYFFHPGAWYVNRQMNHIRECLRDAMVVSTGHITPERYRQGLFSVLKSSALRRPQIQWALASGHDFRSMANRLQYLREVKPMLRRHAFKRWVVIVLLGLFLLPMAPYGNQGRAKTATKDRGIQRLELTQGWFARKYDPGMHVRAKIAHRLHPAVHNPGIRSPQKQLGSFQSAIENGERPSIVYSTGGAPVRAAAAGIVHFIGQGRSATGDAAGFYVRVAHDNIDALRKTTYPRATLYRPQAYRTSYYNLERVAVNHWQSVKRGQVIGYGKAIGADSYPKVQIVLEERGNWVDPDQYGAKHSFMEHWAGQQDLEISLNEMNRRLDRQVEIVHRLQQYYASNTIDNIYTKIHTVIDTERFKQYPVLWSTLDRFRYLASRYDEDPSQFPSLSPTEFRALEESFYSHQAIILTLPFD